jgi:hypothetical protein
MSSDRSSDLVVLAVRRSTAVQLLDVLRDWSSVGLIGPVHLVDVDSIRPGELLVPCTLLAAGATRAVVLQEEVASRERPDLLRVCGITDVARTVTGVRADEALWLLNSLRTSLPGVEVVPLHLIGLALQGASPTEDIGWLGWHNVAIAPENSLSPSEGVSPIVFTDGDPVRLTHFAAAICSLSGLWAAERSGPLDMRPVAPGRSLMAARTFTRHLSAAAVESELLSRLASVQDGYPVPLFEGASAWVVEDEVGAVTDMAEALLQKHAYLLPRPREMPRPAPATKIGAMQALKMLFSFLWQALRNAPKAFLDRLVNEVSSRTAAFVGGVVFGSSEEYAVVVNGVRADGLPASWPEIDEALDVAAARAGGHTEVTHMSNADLSGLWKDFIGGGLTLLDAGARAQEMPPRMSGARRGIVATARRVASDPSEVFQPSEGVAPYVKDRSVPSYDVVASRALNDQLKVIGEQQPHLLAQMNAAQSELQAWFGDRERSYTGRVGLRIARALTGVRDEITQFAQAMRSAQAAADVPSQIEEQQSKLAFKLKVVFLGALLAVLVVVLVTVLGPPGWIFLVTLLTLICAAWLISSFVMFMRGQRDLFALLHQRNQLANQIEVLRQHLIDAIEDMRRLTRAYRQYLDWAKAFGRFVQAPLGHPTAESDNELLIGSGFPRNHRFGAARPDGVVLDDASARMKQDLFQVGWASDAWDDFLSDVPREMGQDGFRLREDAALLFADPGSTRQSILTAWSNVIANRKDWEGATDALRGRVGALLGGQGAVLASQLLANVDTRSANGDVESVSYESFMNRLDSEASLNGAHQTFDRAIFADRAQSAEPWRVAETVSKTSPANLGRTLVVTQLSQGFNTYDLTLGVTLVAAAAVSGFPGAPAESVPHTDRPVM